MCLTTPGKVIKIKNDTALIQILRRQRHVNISALRGVKSGDWVLVQADLALKRISASEAKKISKLFDK